jgi:copper transport protein
MSFTKHRESYPMYLFLISVAFIIYLLIINSTSAYAHTTLEKTFPNSGEILKESPSKIELWFQDDVVVTSSSIKLTDRLGKEFPILATQVDPRDNRHVTALTEDELPSGFYSVEIDVLAPDGDRLREMFQFVVEVPEMDQEEMWRLLELEKSFPEDGVIVQSSPKQIELWFTQPAQLTAIGIFNDRYEVVSIDSSFVDSDNPNKHIIPINEELSPGTYTISWYAGIAGKERNGNIYFAVQEYSSIIPPSGQSVGSSPFSQIEFKSFADWLAFLGILTLFGGTWFLLFIIRQKEVNKRWTNMSLILYGVGMIGFSLLLLHSWLNFSYLSIVEFLTLRFTWIPIIQIIVITIAFWLTKGRLQIILYGLGIFLWAFMGHSAQPRYGGQFGILINALHLYGVGIWMGGLFALIVLTPKENAVGWLKEKGKAYSKWAFWSVLLIILTGVIMTIQYVPSFTLTSLFASDWGKLLWYKAVLLIGIVGLGYLQRHSLKRLNQKMVSIFSIRATVELIIGGIIILGAAILIAFSPSEAEQGVYPKTVIQDGVEASVQFSPFQVGVTDVTIQFKGKKEFEKVQLEFTMPPRWKVEQTAFSLGNGTYKVTGNFIHAAGTMYVKAKAVKADGKEIIFPFRIQTPGKMPSTIKAY